MSLIVQHLTRDYGAQRAVNDISFSVNRGEIAGFLGPNGAGKSTTMKIATGYLPPTSGMVRVGGFDVRSEALQVKKITGYLPEHNPLYPEMFVHEYLRFAGGLYGLKGIRLRHRVAEMVERCGLGREQNKKIDALSKGYRQRVGLAHALIHDPEVLILDEPTSGLDPNQILEIRKLIREVSENKTVIFSTHIMQEVQALCDRVIVISKGRIVADDTLESLVSAKTGDRTLVIEFEHYVSIEDLKLLPGVADASSIGEGYRYRIHQHPGVDVRPEVFRFAADRKLSLIGIRQEESSLENIFRDLTHSS